MPEQPPRREVPEALFQPPLPDAPTPPAPAPPASAAAPRRKRVRARAARAAAERKRIQFRLDETLNRRLTVACRRTGDGRQDIIEAALNRLFDELQIPAEPTPEEVQAAAPTRTPTPRTSPPVWVHDYPVTVWLLHRTRDRLKLAWDRTGTMPKYLGIEALEHYFDALGIPDDPPEDDAAED
ncbi:ribbon-helix-helix protein, CopG family [Bailinhaonella thermotolerans]|uniref:Uncharacterized protein n=1 Tax=Bailinhaonella thermotolerans TaxID=1070861 RepID=A0A3A4AP66_9ACTN|nr:ribbon-helix-helix protein, CopG family [Bailinhaonella thermotolerans]RJL21055.1 hypothetical protein D5H75_38220 [Bailinhaonella thermotolerans]